MLIDTHAHLDFPEFSNDLPSVLDRAMQNGVQRIITIGINLASSQQVIDLAHRYRQVYATVGIHPHDAFLMDEEALSIFRSLAREDRVLAIGETGLDYHRDRQPRAIQRKCLNRQLEVACDLKLPVVFHIREAFDDFFDIVAPYVPSLAGESCTVSQGTGISPSRRSTSAFTFPYPVPSPFPRLRSSRMW